MRARCAPIFFPACFPHSPLHAASCAPTAIQSDQLNAHSLIASWLLSGRRVEHWAVARSNPIALPALLLFGVILLGMTYSEADWRDKWEHFRVYSKLPFLLLLVALLQEQKWQERCWVAFVAAMAVVVGATYLVVLPGMQWLWVVFGQGSPTDRVPSSYKPLARTAD